MTRTEAVNRNRPRGIYIPLAEVPAHLANGWRVLDDCPAGAATPAPDECLLLPPAVFREAA